MLTISQSQPEFLPENTPTKKGKYHALQSQTPKSHQKKI